MAKYNSADSWREWIFDFGASEELELVLWDNSEATAIGRKYDTVAPTARWMFCTATCDGSDTEGGIKVYLDGVKVDDASAATGAGTYATMENLDAKPSLGYLTAAGGPGNFLNAKMAGAPIGPFFTQVELSADVVLRLYELGRRALAL